MEVIRQRRWHTVLILVGVMAFAFLVIGFVTPGWTRLKLEMETPNGIKLKADSSVGLWYIVSCVQNSDCMTISMAASLKKASEMKEFTKSVSSQFGVGLGASTKAYLLMQTEATISVIVIVAAVIATMAFTLCHTKHARRFAICAIVAYTFSGSLDLYVVFSMFSGNIAISDQLPVVGGPGNPDITALSVPYSLVVSGIGGSLAVTNAIIIFFYIQTLKRQTKKEYDDVEFQLLTNKGDPNLNE